MTWVTVTPQTADCCLIQDSTDKLHQHCKDFATSKKLLSVRLPFQLCLSTTAYTKKPVKWEDCNWAQRKGLGGFPVIQGWCWVPRLETLCILALSNWNLVSLFFLTFYFYQYSFTNNKSWIFGDTSFKSTQLVYQVEAFH